MLNLSSYLTVSEICKTIRGVSDCLRAIVIRKLDSLQEMGC